MPEMKRYKQGQFSWADLATSDEQGALKFYGALFGWKDDPQPMGPGSFYHMQQVKGRAACAINQQRPEEAAQGVPPHWNSYVTVDDVNSTARLVPAAGGRVIGEPFDVFDSGRMAVITDSTGAFLSLWQPKRHIGAGIYDETGTLTWFELLTTDLDKAVVFYKSVLGVKSEKMPGPMEYSLLKVDGKNVAGVFRITKEMGPVPPSWTVYFRVENCDAASQKAQSLGATVLMPPHEIPNVGRFAVLKDPQGAVFNIYQHKH
ncbi:MAG: VOC family protein [Chloroflexi bacterium]|nr:VOC family protein [Chloroflexota bacterium]